MYEHALLRSTLRSSSVLGGEGGGRSSGAPAPVPRTTLPLGRGGWRRRRSDACVDAGYPARGHAGSRIRGIVSQRVSGVGNHYSSSGATAVVGLSLQYACIIVMQMHQPQVFRIFASAMPFVKEKKCGVFFRFSERESVCVSSWCAAPSQHRTCRIMFARLLRFAGESLFFSSAVLRAHPPFRTRVVQGPNS